jgi:adenylate cyclase
MRCGLPPTTARSTDLAKPACMAVALPQTGIEPVLSSTFPLALDLDCDRVRFHLEGTLMRIRVGYQLSITTLFVFVVLGVGLALVYLSFDRAKAISRSAAVTFIDRVAEHTADTVDRNFESVLQAVEVVKQFPSIQMGTISADPQLYALMAALLREHKQLYNIYVGYDDGSFIELDALDRAGPAVRAQLEAPEQAAFRLVIIAKRLLETGANRHTTFLSTDLWPVSDSWRPADYDPGLGIATRSRPAPAM